MTTAALSDHDDRRSEPRRSVSGDGYDLRASFPADDEPKGSMGAVSTDDAVRDDPSISGDGFALLDSPDSRSESDSQSALDDTTELQMRGHSTEEDDAEEYLVEPEGSSIWDEKTTSGDVELPTDDVVGDEEQFLFNTEPEDRPASLDGPLLDVPRVPGWEFRRKLRLASESTVESGKSLVSVDRREPDPPPSGQSEISSEGIPPPRSIFARDAGPISNTDSGSGEEAVPELGSMYEGEPSAGAKAASENSIEVASEEIETAFDVEADKYEIVDSDAFEHVDFDNDQTDDFGLGDIENSDLGASADLDEDVPDYLDGEESDILDFESDDDRQHVASSDRQYFSSNDGRVASNDRENSRNEERTPTDEYLEIENGGEFDRVAGGGAGFPVPHSEDTASWERELTQKRPAEGERDDWPFTRVDLPESRIDGDGYVDLHISEDGYADSAIGEDGHVDSAIREDGYADSAIGEDGYADSAIGEDDYVDSAISEDAFSDFEVSREGSADSSISEDASFGSDIPEDGHEDSGQTEAVYPDTDRQGGAHSDSGGPTLIGPGVEMRDPYRGRESADADEELLTDFAASEDQGTAADDAVTVSEQRLGDDAGGTTTGDGYSLLDLQDRVVIMLLFKQLVRVEDVEQAWREWNEQSGGASKEPLWRYMTSDPSFDRDIIFAEAAQVYAFTEASIDEQRALQILKSFKESVDETVFQRMQSLRVIPVRRERKPNSKHSRVLFVSHDPTRPEVHRWLRELKGQSYEMQYAPEVVIEDLISKAFPARNEYLERVSDSEMAYDLGTSYDLDEELIDEDALEAEIGRSTLINLFEASLVEAVRRDVSDVHIFPNARKQIEIHFRINGELECWHRDDRIHPEAFLAVVKDNSLNVDRFERDAAQDGFIQRKIDDTLIRFRVSVLPVANANQEIRSESIVIRVLDDRKVITDLGRLGLLESARTRFEWAISQPHGMVILTGPTGSGKTTTLFAALSQVVTPKLNVLTVEDPVEYVIPGVRQVKLSHKLNLEQALRAILRHDPDVVMVGEMRDRQTADLAIKLANTGHLTFSTLHTNDAPSAISRLYKMGVEPFLIAYAINLVVAQRLVRVLCRNCKKPLESFDEPMLERLGFTTEDLTRAEFFEEGHDPSCRACGGSGYRGRRAITETMAFSNEIRRQIVLAQNMIDEDTIRQLAENEGMLSLRASAREVVIQGETSVSELVRVTASEN